MAFVAWRSDVGTTRGVNQDACCVEVAKTCLGEAVMAVVCDGVGGLSSGEVASASVTSYFASWFDRDLRALLAQADKGLALRSVRAGWESLLSRAHRALRAHGEREGIVLATTCTALLLLERSYLVAHVGDSRAYVLHGGAATQVTQDQTLTMLDGAGGNASRHLRAGTLLQAVGAGRVPEPVFHEGVLDPGDVALVCSDGACRRVGRRGIEQAFAAADPVDEGQLANACARLLALSMRSGETDNLTVVCVSCQDHAEAADAPTRAGTIWELPPLEDELETLAGDACAGVGAEVTLG